MKKRRIWSEASVEECWRRTGRAPVSTGWVDTDKGLDGHVDVRSRLVARDFKGKGGGKEKEDSIHAATPPLEGLRMLCSKATAPGRTSRQRKMLFMDAKKAHLNPKCTEEVYIQLPEEAGVAEGMCGKLEFWMYGMRPAAQAWEELYSQRMEEVGFRRGVGNSVVFYCEARDLSVLVHGDDFVVVAEDDDVEWLQKLSVRWFEMKVRGKIGDDAEDEKEMVILGRRLRWTQEGLELEADKDILRRLKELFGFDEWTKAAASNGEKENEAKEAKGELLGKAEATSFRAAVALVNYYAQDAPDALFAAKEASKDMANPRKGSWAKLKR